MMTRCMGGYFWQTAHEVEDMQEQLNVWHDPGSDVIPNMTRDSRVKYITYYEDGTSLPGKRTAVWELDKGMSPPERYFTSGVSVLS